MLRRFAYTLLTALAAGAAAACGGAEDTAPPVATPSVTLAGPEAAIGSPMEMAYRFAVAPDAPAFAEDYWVFVHFKDTDGELMWTDDHPPPTPTRSWTAGETIDYPRTMFVPRFPYVGETRVEIGLFSPATGERLPLAGETEGQRAYIVGTFDLRLQTDNLFVVFRDGWHQTEVAGDSGIEWQWSEQEAILAFPNPRRDVTVYLQVDQPATGAFAEPQRVEVRLGPAVVDAFDLPPGPFDLRRISITADQLGTADTVEMALSVDKTFVPALIPALRSADPRELGVRVFRVYVQPS